MGQDEIRALLDRWIIAPFDKVVHRLLYLSSLETPRNLHRRFNERLREVLRETRGVPASTVHPGDKGMRRVYLLRTCPLALKDRERLSSSTRHSGTAKSSSCIRSGIPKVSSAATSIGSSPNTGP